MREPEFYLGKPIRSLQTMLRHISEADSRILPLIPDGFYGRNTYASVRSFQQAYGLPDTGEVDPITWDAIVAVHNKILPERFSPITAPVWPSAQAVAPGETNYHIFLVQAMLAVLADFFPAVQSPTLTGILDPVTEAGLRWVQTAGGLPVTGALNTATWHYLNGLYRIMAGNGIPSVQGVG